MIFYDMQEFGGLEEYAIALAIGLQQQGHAVSILSTAWVQPENQYLLRIRQNKLRFVQLPKWISYPVSDWSTKEKILSILLRLLTPLTFFLAIGVSIGKRRSPKRSYISAYNWLRGQMMDRVVGPDRRKVFARLLLNWWRILWQPDLFHIHGYTTNLLFVIDWAYAKKIPVVYEEHQTPDAQFDWWGDFEQTINKASRIVAVSEKSAKALKEVCGVTRPIVVRNPLLADPADSGWLMDARKPSIGERLAITTVARLYVTKGLKYLLEAIVIIREAFPETQFKVYGDGPLCQELLDYAAQLGLDGKEIFVGPFNHKDLPEIMSVTDIFVMPSILEGQPLALVEAMAYGCPIVATSVGGIPELIQTGVNGLLCEPGNSECLARAIHSLIENPELRREFGRAARSSYEQGPFQPGAVSDHFVSIYREVLQVE